MTIAVRDFDSKADLLTAMEALMRETLSQASDTRFALMISGGNTMLLSALRLENQVSKGAIALNAINVTVNNLAIKNPACIS